MKSFSAESRQYYPGNFDDSPPRLVLPPVAWTTHGPESLTFEECERLEEEEASYIRDAMLKERALHWRSQLGAEAVRNQLAVVPANAGTHTALSSR